MDVAGFALVDCLLLGIGQGLGFFKGTFDVVDFVFLYTCRSLGALSTNIFSKSYNLIEQIRYFIIDTSSSGNQLEAV